MYFDTNILPSYKYYGFLEQGYGRIDDETYWENIENDIDKYPDISMIKETLLKGFYYVSYLKNKEEFWYYLYYWMGKKLLDKLKNFDEFSKIMGTLDNVKYKFNNNQRYNAYYISQIDKVEFLNLKLIYEYYKNYEFVQGTISEGDIQCSKAFEEYFKQCYVKYTELNSKCILNEGLFCKLFDDIKRIHNNVQLKQLQCKITEDSIEQHGAEGTALSGITGEDGKQTFTRESMQMQSHSESNFQHPDSASPLVIVIACALPFIGISLIFYILHKFSPLNSWLRTRLLRNKEVRYNAEDEKINEYLESTYNSMIGDLERNEHQIEYYPIGNN
ncbi:PIR protein [Plasmodium ovale]|uniref:PIR protein n=1 Tax=Plasmodium ovale TaxID=36330 RepID=A0A1D3JEW5_PLAOA|nr:PIR protein [Plasmodium ovale]